MDPVTLVTLLPPPLNSDRLACNLSYDGHSLQAIDEAVERAAIVEYCGQVDRERAEAAAIKVMKPAANA